MYYNMFYFEASFQWLLHATLPNEVRPDVKKEPTFGRMLYCIIINGLCCTPVMMMQMSFFQLISFDAQGMQYIIQSIVWIYNWTLHLSWTNDHFIVLLFLGLPTARGTLIAVISTYIILIILNVVISKQGSDTRDSLRSRDKNMDRVSRYCIAAKERLASMY